MDQTIPQYTRVAFFVPVWHVMMHSFFEFFGKHGCACVIFQCCGSTIFPLVSLEVVGRLTQGVKGRVLKGFNPKPRTFPFEYTGGLPGHRLFVLVWDHKIGASSNPIFKPRIL